MPKREHSPRPGPRRSAWCAAAAVAAVLGGAARAGDAFDVAAAIRAAAPGATIRVPAGVYPALVIDKPVVLEADGQAVIDAGGRDDVVRITAPDVTLRGFLLRGSGDSLDRENAGLVVNAPRALIENNRLEDVLLGMIVQNAHETVVRGNYITGKPLDAGRRGDGIRLWNSNHVKLERNEVFSARDVVIWYSTGTHITENRVTAGRYGLHFMYANESVLERNTLTNNSVGVFLMYSRDIVLRRNVLADNRGPSGYGLGLKDMDAVTVEENTIAGNRVGVFFDNSPQRVDIFGEFHGNVIAYNDVGLAFQPSVKRNRFSNNSFVENLEQVALLGSGNFAGNFFTIDGRGNYWSDFAGFDADRDGIGDVPYRNLSLFENLMDREPKLRLFLYSPAQQAIELAARAFPIVRPTPKFTDDRPLMIPIPPAVQPVAQAQAAPLASAGAGICGLAALVWAGLRRRGLARMAPARSAATTAEVRVVPAAAAAAIAARGPVVTVRGLTKKFGRMAAVDNLDLDVQPGEAVALWGVNGAGKTTIIKCLLGLLPYRGQVSLGGFDVRRAGKAARRSAGYVSQELAFYDDLTALEALRFFARLRRAPLERADVVLAQVGLSEHARKTVRAMSGGMKQRLALAVALLSDPPVLVLDEATANLDTAARRVFLQLLCDLRAAGKSIVFSTHRAEEVLQLADRVIVLNRGRVVASGRPEELDEVAGLNPWLRLAVGAEQSARAEAALSAAGYAVQRDGAALRIRVAAQRKAGPLAALYAAGVTVENFELESEAGDVS